MTALTALRRLIGESFFSQATRRELSSLSDEGVLKALILMLRKLAPDIEEVMNFDIVSFALAC